MLHGPSLCLLSYNSTQVVALDSFPPFFELELPWSFFLSSTQAQCYLGPSPFFFLSSNFYHPSPLNLWFFSPITPLSNSLGYYSGMQCPLEEILSFATKKSITKCLKQLVIYYNNKILFQILRVKSCGVID
jgi:hypothetical protein